MKYIEVSRKVRLTKESTQEELKQAFLNRLRRAFDINNLKEQDAGFFIDGTTGGPGSITRHARVDLDISVVKNQENVRILVHGYSRMARSLLVTYTLLFFTLLLLGLAPGSIETGGENSGAMDALVFLIFGIFIFYDINRKLMEPREHLEAILESLDTEFG